MKNDKSQFVVRISDFYLSFVICHLTENPCQATKNFHVTSIDMDAQRWCLSCTADPLIDVD